MTQRSIDRIHTLRKKMITRRVAIHPVIDSYSRMIVGWEVRFSANYGIEVHQGEWAPCRFPHWILRAARRQCVSQTNSPNWKAVVERRFAGVLQKRSAWSAGRLRRKSKNAKGDSALTKTRRKK